MPSEDEVEVGAAGLRTAGGLSGKRGDPSPTPPHGSLAIEELTNHYIAHRAKLRQYALTFVDDYSLAEDVVQQAYVKTCESLNSGRAIDNVPSWLFRCVRNLAIDQQRREPALAFDEELYERGISSLAHQAHIREQLRAVEGAVAALPDHFRHAFVLAELRGMAYEEIAGEMHKSVGAVRQILRRARQQVREMVGADTAPLALPFGSAFEVHGSFGDLIRSLRDRISGQLHGVHAWLDSLGTRTTEAAALPAAALVVGALAVATVVGSPATSRSTPPTVIGTPAPGDMVVPDHFTGPPESARSRTADAPRNSNISAPSSLKVVAIDQTDRSPVAADRGDRDPSDRHSTDRPGERGGVAGNDGNTSPVEVTPEASPVPGGAEDGPIGGLTVCGSCSDGPEADPNAHPAGGAPEGHMSVPGVQATAEEASVMIPEPSVEPIQGDEPAATPLNGPALP